MLFLLFKITTSFKFTTWTIVIKADSNHSITYNMASTSSTIAILSGASLAVSAAVVGGGVSKTDAQDVNNNNGALPHHHKPQINLQSTTLGKECNTLTLDNNNDKWVAKSEDNKDNTDIGLLIVDCNNDNENCLPDDTSSLGGRCTTKDITNSPPAYKTSTNVNSKRQLRHEDADVEWIKDALDGKVSI